MSQVEMEQTKQTSPIVARRRADDGQRPIDDRIFSSLDFNEEREPTLNLFTGILFSKLDR